MTRPDRPVTEDDLQAWVDDLLSSERRRTVETWLDTNPDTRTRVTAWRAERNLLRATMDDEQAAGWREPLLRLTLSIIARTHTRFFPQQARSYRACFHSFRKINNVSFFRRRYALPFSSHRS
nr:hypothetical protein [Acetobacter persici]